MPQTARSPRLADLVHPSVGGAAGLLVVVAGLAVGLGSLSDNSFLTHLATGRIILETGSVPSSDPYTFTALGEPWVVQSWVPSWLYATVESLAGGTGLRLLMGLGAAGVTVVGWRLTRSAQAVVGRLLLATLFLVVGGGMWSERPLMFGMLGLGLVVLAADGGLDPRWLVPVGWIWVNSHGSFPLGLVYLVVVAVGRRMDGSWPGLELRVLRWLGLGILVGGIGPVGFRLLTFPVELLRRQDVLANVVEWQAPAFQSVAERAFLAQVILAVVLLVRRPSYRSALVIAAFSAAALLGSRNVAVASLVMLPAMAPGLVGLGTILSQQRTQAARLVAGAGVAMLVLVTAVRLGQPDFELAAYPADALAVLEGNEIDVGEVRLAAPDIVGNYLEVVDGAAGAVFYDDRFDMFPDDVSKVHLALTMASPGALHGLDDLDVDLVIWKRGAPLATVLAVDARWRTMYQGDVWQLSCRRGAELSESFGSC